MHQNGSGGSSGSSGSDGPGGGGGGGRERQQAPSFSPLPSATTRVRRFIQERRTLPLPRVMVVFSAAGDTDKPGDAMSGSDTAEDELRKPPASPSPSRGLSKPLRPALSAQEQEVGRSTDPMDGDQHHVTERAQHRLTHWEPHSRSAQLQIEQLHSEEIYT